LSVDGAQNLIRGKATQNPTSLAAINALGTFLGCKPDEIAVGCTLTKLPHDMLVPILDAMIAAVKAPYIKNWLCRWRDHPEPLRVRRLTTWRRGGDERSGRRPPDPEGPRAARDQYSA
jgi:hypothetical protein